MMWNDGNFGTPAINMNFQAPTNPWGPTGANPPAGWTILDNQYKKYDTNDWSKYYYSSWADTVAEIYYRPRENPDELLISPTFDFTAGYDSLELSF